MALLSTDLVAQATNPWFTTDYVTTAWTFEVRPALDRHVLITLYSVIAGVIAAVPLALIARRSTGVETFIIGLTGVIYTVPSLALFALLVPLTGFTQTTAVIALAAYTLVILVRNIVIGLAQVPDDVVESARGMGLGPVKTLVKVEMPIALPSIIAGIRVATVSTISLLTVAAYVGVGGFGQLITQAFIQDYRAKLTTAIVFCVVLALVADALLVLLQRLLTPWARANA